MCVFNDIYYYYFGLQKVRTDVDVAQKIKNIFRYLNDKRKYILKKYVYTINHKRIAINYFYFSM
jgi:hypothetical protein